MNAHEQRDFDVFSSDAYFLFSSPEFQNSYQLPKFSHILELLFLRNDSSAFS